MSTGEGRFCEGDTEIEGERTGAKGGRRTPEMGMPE
jgi:hypothetical protein